MHLLGSESDRVFMGIGSGLNQAFAGDCLIKSKRSVLTRSKKNDYSPEVTRKLRKVADDRYTFLMSFFRRSPRGGAPPALISSLLLIIGLSTDLVGVHARQKSSALDGLWRSECVDHRRRFLQFLGGELTDVVEVFLDEGCEKRLGTLVRISSFELPGGEERNGPGRMRNRSVGLRELDLVVHSVSWTPEHPRYVAAFNSVSECGINDWSPGSARNILGLRQDCYFLESRTSYPAEPNRVPEVGDRLLEVAKMVSQESTLQDQLGEKIRREQEELSKPKLQISVDFGHSSHIQSRADQLSPEVYQKD